MTFIKGRLSLAAAPSGGSGGKSARFQNNSGSIAALDAFGTAALPFDTLDFDNIGFASWIPGNTLTFDATTAGIYLITGSIHGSLSQGGSPVTASIGVHLKCGNTDPLDTLFEAEGGPVYIEAGGGFFLFSRSVSGVHAFEDGDYFRLELQRLGAAPAGSLLTEATLSLVKIG